MADREGPGDGPRVESRPSTVPIAGYVYCLNPRCQAELLPTYHDNHKRLYFLAGAVRIYVRHALSLVCPRCGEWRRWGDRARPIDMRLNHV